MNDPTSVRQSDGYLNKFNDFEFSLLVIIFNGIFGLTDVLFDVLQKKSFDINFCISQIKNMQMLSNNKRNEETLMGIFNLAVLKPTIPTKHREEQKRVTLTRDQVFEKYKILFYEILDTISLQITTRFQDIEKFHFITSLTLRNV